jgi:hypothetical protein
MFAAFTITIYYVSSDPLTASNMLVGFATYSQPHSTRAVQLLVQVFHLVSHLSIVHPYTLVVFHII